MRYRLVRFAALMVVPYFYLRIYLAGTKMRPSDYFLELISERKGRYAQAILFVILLSMAARSFDAAMAVKAIKSLYSPIPLWALSVRDIRLLFEAPLWLESESEFDMVREGVLRQSDSSGRVRSILSFYESFARKEMELTDAVRGQMVLPGLFWDRVATKSTSDGRVRDAVDALHQSLRFVPENDPRRAELVARFFQAEAILNARAM